MIRITRLIDGAISGLIATVPMTLIMHGGHRMLPRREQYPLPPSEIVQVLGEEVGIEQQISEDQHVAVSLVAHFAYGTTAGAMYAPTLSKLPLPAIISGIAYGLLVWAASYLGWLPAVGILRPATEHPQGRNALNVGSHIVWGAVLGLLYDRIRHHRLTTR